MRAVQLACVHRWDMCSSATASAAATGGAALLPLLHELLLAALARVEALCRHVPRTAPVGLRPGSPATAILHLLQCAPPAHHPLMHACTLARTCMRRYRAHTPRLTSMRYRAHTPRLTSMCDERRTEQAPRPRRRTGGMRSSARMRGAVRCPAANACMRVRWGGLLQVRTASSSRWQSAGETLRRGTARCASPALCLRVSRGRPPCCSSRPLEPCTTTHTSSCAPPLNYQCLQADHKCMSY